MKRHLIYLAGALLMGVVAGDAARTPRMLPWQNLSDVTSPPMAHWIGAGLIAGVAAYLVFWAFDALTGGCD